MSLTGIVLSNREPPQLKWCPLQWLILGVNLTRLSDARIVGKALFLGVLWGCLQKRLALDSVDWVKSIHPSQGGWASSHPLRDRNRTKTQREGEFCLSSWVGTCTFSSLGHWGSRFSGLRTPGLTPVAPSSQAVRLGLNYFTAFRVLQLDGRRSGDSSAFMTR